MLDCFWHVSRRRKHARSQMFFRGFFKRDDRRYPLRTIFFRFLYEEITRLARRGRTLGSTPSRARRVRELAGIDSRSRKDTAWCGGGPPEGACAAAKIVTLLPAQGCRDGCCMPRSLDTFCSRNCTFLTTARRFFDHSFRS